MLVHYFLPYCGLRTLHLQKSRLFFVLLVTDPNLDAWNVQLDVLWFRPRVPGWPPGYDLFESRFFVTLLGASFHWQSNLRD